MESDDDEGIRWWHYGLVVAFHPFDWCWRFSRGQYAFELIAIGVGPLHMRIAA